MMNFFNLNNKETNGFSDALQGIELIYHFLKGKNEALRLCKEAIT